MEIGNLKQQNQQLIYMSIENFVKSQMPNSEQILK